MNRGFRLDLNKCTGCDACRLACAIENGLEPGDSWRQVFTFNESRLPSASLFHLSLACNHCGNAPCISACPAKAIARDGSTGAVLIDEELCTGCRYCSWACPYEAPRYREGQGVMAKCTFCSHRLAAGVDPACVTLCPTGALGTAPCANGAGVAEVPGFHADGHEPLIRFVPLRRGFRAPEMTSQPELEAAGLVSAGRARGASGRISLRGEWPLVAFTLVAAALVGWVAAAVFCGVPVSAPVFLALAAAAMAVSVAHLGRIGRSWRAMLNLGSSWLSREVALYGLFVVLATGWFLLAPASPVGGWAALAAGMALLFAIDRIYDVARKEIPSRLHSAGALWVSLYLASVLSGSPVVAGAVAGAKLVLYAARKARVRQQGRARRPLLPVARVAAGLVAPAILLLLWTEAAWVAAVCFAAGGEVMDRLEYYMELRIESPRDWMQAALERAINPGGLGAA